MSHTSTVGDVAADTDIAGSARLTAALVLDPPSAARALLGSTIRATDDDGAQVALRIVEVEAYGGDPDGPWPDPAAHSYPGPTARNAAMFGPPGHLYVYRSYGIHLCGNVTCGPDGVGGGVLMRAGEVIAGIATARARRPKCRSEADLARGPGNLGSTLGLRTDDYGLDLFAADSRIRLEPNDRTPPVSCGPRVGVRSAPDRPWRFWVTGSPQVSSYRRSPRAAPTGSADTGDIRSARRTSLSDHLAKDPRS